MVLSEEHQRTLKRLGEEYEKWIKSEEGLKETREHREHQILFREKLSSENIDSLTEDDFKEICKNLWAIRGWTDKEWRIENQILVPNEFDKIKSELKKLLYGTDEFARRYVLLLYPLKIVSYCFCFRCCDIIVFLFSSVSEYWHVVFFKIDFIWIILSRG